jgi:phosphate starvation-inducible protein PhoH and related proteins
MSSDLRLKNVEEARTLLGPLDRNANLIRKAFEVDLVHRGDQLKILGPEGRVQEVRVLLEKALQLIRKGQVLSHRDIERWIDGEEPAPEEKQGQGAAQRRDPKPAGVRPRTDGQKHYLRALQTNDVVFAIGPAGTGKTYLAVAQAVDGLRAGRYKRIVLTRPAVEAGEKLGFLPGDFQAKVDPYLRPLHDALSDLLDPPVWKRYQENDLVEVCPLAYMRGRTLNQAFIILDEAQNTTISQMRMLLTRMGEGSMVVVTGDVTQVDLPKGVPSGLVDAVERLRGVKGLTVVELHKEDIVRHRVVMSIVEAYETSQHHRPSPEDRSANPVRSRARRGR